MKSLLPAVIIVLLTATPVATASSSTWWVLGSFRNEDNANAEAARIESILNQPVIVRFHDPGNVYRVVTASRGVTAAEIAAHGLAGWLVAFEKSPGTEPQRETRDPEPVEKESAQVLVELTVPEEPEPDVIKTTGEWPPLYPALSPGETIAAYCERLPDSPLCREPGSQALIESARKLQAHKREIDGACERIQNPDYRETCLNLQN